jgi:RHS repeat-associated protein
VGPNPRTYVPDAAGNVLSDGVNQFAYDGRGRLKFATNKDGGTQFLINGLGQRVAKLDCPDPPRCERPPSSGRYFVHDEAGRLLGEYDHRGVPVQEFVYLDDMLVAVLMRDGRFFVYPDHLGTPRAISEAATGNVVWRWDHSDPFGATLPEEGRDQTGRLFTFNLRFPGQYFDQETGLFHNYFRDYDPQTGRYIQPDPIGLDGGINPYVYAEGNPLSYYDPYGLESWLDSLFLGALLPDLGGGIQDCPKGDLWCQIGFSLFEPNEAPPLFGPKFSGSRFGPKFSGSRALIPHPAHSSSSPRALIPHPVLSSSAPTRALVRQSWPPRGGALMGGQPWIINRGTLLSRIGELKGKYAAPLGTPFGARGLPLHYASKPDHRLLTLKPLSSLRGFSSPAFGQRGFGEQF